MGRTRQISKAKADVLMEGLDDSIGIWEIAAVVRGELPRPDDRAVRAASLEIVEDVLEEGLMRSGFPAREGAFEVLRKTHRETLERVEREWDELYRAPDVGEGIWFDLTEKGEEYARKLEESSA
ncbi:MAG: hypothetical protein M3494_17885 [Actinomycetota bacterium]|nr:hypothetical protein [Rubrobacter sp.]MDQ3509848.1 hypothetical protein [Actinomycetota bacterium]